MEKSWSSSSLPKSAAKCDIKNMQVVASYNWLEDNTLVVPGSPGVLSRNLHSNLQLQREKGTNIIDENHLRHPEAPLEPLFRSVLECSPDFDYSDVDIATDRNNIRKLHSFIAGTRTKNFRMDVCRIGDLVLLQRVEPKDVDYPEFAGFGFDFERQYVKRLSPHSKGTHRRVVFCDLGGLGLLIRSETDGVLELEDQQSESVENDLSAALGQVRIEENKSDEFEDSTLAVRKAGTPVSEVKNGVVELKTKAICC